MAGAIFARGAASVTKVVVVSCLPFAGQIGEPLVERIALGVFHVGKRDAHSQSGLRIDDRTASFELRLALVDLDANIGTDGKRNQGVHETAPRPEVGGAGGEFGPRNELGDFGRGSDEVPIIAAALSFF